MVRFHYKECGRVAPEYAGVTVFHAEIIKMLALVVCITAWQKCNDELTINRSNAGNRTKGEIIMCEFCEMLKKDIYCENKPIISHIKQSIDGIGTIVCGIDGNLLKVSSMVQTSTGICPPIVGEEKINYCPMCGRKLSEV